jgi:sterol 24-C-methyltransferase
LLGKQLNFVEHNMNHRFPWADGSFDGFYQVQAMTYAVNLTDVFCEISRVLKPGAKMSILEGVAKDAYNSSNLYHRSLLARTRQVTGWGVLKHHDIFKQAVEDCGMKVITSKELSVGGKQGLLIRQEMKHFHLVIHIVNFLTTLRLLPQHFSVLLERFDRHVEAFIEMDDKEMLTTSWHIMAQKI